MATNQATTNSSTNPSNQSNTDWIFRLNADGNAEGAVAMASSVLTKDINKLTQELAKLKAEFQNGYIAAQVAVGDAMEASGTFQAVEQGAMAAGSFLTAASSAKGMADHGRTHGEFGNKLSACDKEANGLDDEEKAIDEGVTAGTSRPSPLEERKLKEEISRRRSKLKRKRDSLQNDFDKKKKELSDSSSKRQSIASGLQFVGTLIAKEEQGHTQGVQAREQAVSQTEQDMGQTVANSKRDANQVAQTGIQISGTVYQAAVAASKA